jgi:HlyD family secretion protein
MKKIVMIAVILIALIGVIIYAHFFSETQSAGGQGGPRGGQSVPVKVVQVVASDITRVIAVTGTVNARAEVEVYPKQAGELIELRVDKGDKVKAGQILGRIESIQFEIQVKQAQAEMENVKAAYEKNESVAYVNAETSFKQAKSNLERLQAAMKQAEVELQLQTKQADSQIKKAQADLRIAEARLEAIVSGARAQDIEQVQMRRDNTKRDLDRLTTLLKDEIISKDQVEASQLQYEIYSAQLSLLVEGARPEDIEVLKAQMEAEKANLESAQDNRMQIDIKRANLESAKAQVENAQAALEEVEARRNAATWKKELAQAEALLNRAQAALELSQQRLDETVIKAPISGVIVQRFWDKGDTASLNQPFVTIVEVDVVRVAAKVPGRDLAAIQVGASADIKPDAYPGEKFSGKVVFISPAIDRSSQTGEIEVEVPNPNHKLKPGMFARVELMAAEHKNVVVIPSDALLKKGEEAYVYIVNDGTAHKKTVGVGISDGIRTELLSGLAVGESLIIAGQHSLGDGMSVTITGK